MTGRTPHDGGFQQMTDLDEATFAALKESIENRGVLLPIAVDQHGRILDGHNRLAIANDLGIECPTVVVDVENHQDGRDIALLLNTVRRHLDPHRRREMVGELRANGHSLRSIAGAVGTSHTQVRRDLESTGTPVPVPERTTGLDGKSRPSTRPTPPPAPAEDLAPAPVQPAVPVEPLVVPPCCIECGCPGPLVDGLCDDCWQALNCDLGGRVPPEPIPLHQPEPQDDAAMARLKLREAILRARARSAAFYAEFSPELVATALDAEDWDRYRQTLSIITDWYQRLDAHRPQTGLRLMGGGQ